MKKIVSLMLSLLMLASCISFISVASAQDEGVMFSFNYHDKNNGVVDKKLTATVEKVEIDGIKALKVVPTPDTANSPDLRLDCYSLNYPSKDLKGAKYLTIKYRYDGKTELANPMSVMFLKGKGAFTDFVTVNATEKTKLGNWQIALFDISSIESKLDLSEGKIFSQFHFWPYGNGISPAYLKAEQVMYISDITFYNKAPNIAGIKLPTASGNAATSTEPAKPAETTKPATSTEAAKPLEGDENGFLFSFSYPEKNNGVVDRKLTATVEKTELDGKKVLKVVPTPETALTTNVVLDCYSLKYTQAEIANAKFMTIEYKCELPEGTSMSKMKLNLLGNATRAIKSTISASSTKNMKNGVWDTVIFDVSKIKSVLNTSAPDGLFTQFHLYPYGSAAVSTQNEKHVIYIGDISFYSMNPDADTVYTATFKKGSPEVSGDDPQPILLTRGKTFTLPEPTYEVGEAEFRGWRDLSDNKMYQPGDTVTMPDGNAVFSAEYNFAKALAQYKAIPFIDYQNGSCERRDNLIISNDMLDGKDVVKVIPNPKGADVEKGAIIDGWSYSPAGIDFGAYKYMIITYRYDGDLPGDVYFQCNVMKREILTKTYSTKSAEPIKSGSWNFALVDFSTIESAFVPGRSDYVLGQMHIFPFSGAKISDFTGNEALYINNLMFFKEKPTLEMHDSYMKGYDGGIFKPQGNMTRAEACTIVARLSAGGDALVPTDKTTAFTDVPSDQWYHKYVSYVESLGYLKSYSGQFLPNQAITRAEFVELVYNMGLLKDAGKNGTFTDVDASHPKATVIAAAGKAGLVNGYDNGDGTFSFKPDATITRAEVVKVINNAYGRSITKELLSADAKFTFADVDKTFWAYPDIMEAAISHIQDENGWIMCMTSPFSIFGATNDNRDYAAGEAYLKELDKISAEKIEAIRNTPNMDLSKHTGAKYYVSSINGDDNNDGLTPETPWKSIARLVKAQSEIIKAGDVVLFERGSLFRERFTAKGGVTFTAYGEGEKPTFYGSPENGAVAENWTLMEGTTNIWIYKNKLLDVGGIICDNGAAIGLKELPDLFDGQFYVRGSKQSKKFDIVTELDEDLEFFSDVPTASALASTKGTLYFRCDKGNPGELFKQIEFNIKGNVIGNGGNGTTFDNLRIMYTGTHGIGSGTTKNLTVTNCEVAWIGGTIQMYTNGKATRLGNGVEIYGGCDGYLVHNNYIWQCYDAGATHQFSKGGTNDISMNNIEYSDNIIEDCIYNIEYFTGTADTETALRDGKNFVIKNNILRRSGYGWGNQRPDSNTSAHIKSWGHRNEYEKGTYIIENNIFDRGAWKLLQTIGTYSAWCPIYKNNTYVQVIDEGLCEHRDLKLKFDCFAEQAIKYEMGDEDAKVYFLPKSYKHEGFLTRE